MKQATAAPVADSAMLFRALTDRLKGATPEVQQRITAHVRARTSHNTLVSYMSNGATEDEKQELLCECIKAILENDLSGLKGGVPSEPEAAKVEEQISTESPVDAAAFRVGCKQKGDTDWRHNSLVFGSAEEALAYARDLKSRWPALLTFEIQPSEEAVNVKWAEGKAVKLDEEKKEEPAPAPTPPPPVPVATPEDKPEPPPTATTVDDEKVKRLICEVLNRQIPPSLAIYCRGLVKAALQEMVRDTKFELLAAMERGYREHKRDLAKLILDL